MSKKGEFMKIWIFHNIGDFSTAGCFVMPQWRPASLCFDCFTPGNDVRGWVLHDMRVGAGRVRSIGLLGNHQKCQKLTKINENQWKPWWISMIFGYFLTFLLISHEADAPHSTSPHPHVVPRTIATNVSQACQRRLHTWEWSGRSRMNVFVK